MGRFLGFLTVDKPAALDIAPSERLGSDRIRRLITHLAQTQALRTVAQEVDALYQVARDDDARAGLDLIEVGQKSAPPSVQLLDLGLQLMEESKPTTDTRSAGVRNSFTATA